MKVSDYIASYLQAQGVEVVFDLIGGMIVHLIDSIHVQGAIRIVDMHHEQAASFAAEAAARITGVPGIAMGTSGPGAINLLTGIGSCYFDSTPAIFITGQVNRNEQKGSKLVRQLGFQETDIVPMAAPITKAAWRINDPEQVPLMLKNAFELALSGRPGPVLLDIPMDVQRTSINVPPPQPLSSVINPAIAAAAVRDMLTALQAAQRPLILAGGGLRSGRAVAAFRQFVQAVKIPVVNSLMGVDALPYADPLRVGMIGSYGNRWSNHAIADADLLLVLGSRLDIRQTGSQTEAFKGDRVIYQVDIDTSEMNNRIQGCIPITAELQPFFQEALRQLSTNPFPDRAKWLADLAALKQQWPDTDELPDIKGINPNVLMHRLAQASTRAAAYVVDVGQHQMWAAQSLELTADQRFLTSGGMGAMGFALPAAIGVAVAQPGQPVMLVAGDGGFQLNLQELQTVVRNYLPVKMVILNNHTHGMVRQFQQSYFSERYQSTYIGYSAPDFAEVARAYGISALTIDDEAEIGEALAHLWQEPDQPFLLQVMIDTFANVYPKLAFGHPITEMEPFVQPLDMEGT